MTASSPDPACNAPTGTAANSLDVVAPKKSSCTSSDSTLFRRCTVHHLGPAVSSDGSAAEASNAPCDDPDNVPQIVHPISASTKTDGTASAPGTSHNMAIEDSNDTFLADTLEHSIKVAAKNDCIDAWEPDVIITSQESGEGELIYTPREIEEVRTTATEATDTPRTMQMGLVIHEELRESTTMPDASNVANAPAKGVEVEGNVDQEASPKKRKSEDPPTKKDQPTKKKTKVLRDPYAPEKNKTAYMHYATYARAYIKERNPNAKASEVTKTVKDGWKDLTCESRDYWDEQAFGDKARYEKELAVYKNSKQGKAWQAYVAAEEKKQDISNSTNDTNGDKKSAKDSTDPAFMKYDEYARRYISSRHPQKKDIEVTMVVESGWNVLSANVRNYWDRVTLADQLEYVERRSMYQRFEFTVQVQEVVEAKASTQEVLDNLCSDEKEVDI